MERATVVERLEPRRLLSTTITKVGPFQPVMVLADAGISVTAEIGRFTKLSYSKVSQYGFTGTIDWGDGSSSAASLVRRGSQTVDVFGSHAFAQSGHYVVGLELIDSSEPPVVYALVDSSAAVTPTVTGSFLAGETRHHFTDTLGSFTQPADNEVFTGKVHWGDGHVTAAKLIGTDAAQSTRGVDGSHTYAVAGTYTVRTTIYEHARHSNAKPVVEFDLITTITVA